MRLSVDRRPVALHEALQAGEHYAPVPFRFLARLVGEIVISVFIDTPAPPWMAWFAG